MGVESRGTADGNGPSDANGPHGRESRSSIGYHWCGIVFPSASTDGLSLIIPERDRPRVTVRCIRRSCATELLPGDGLPDPLG